MSGAPEPSASLVERAGDVLRRARSVVVLTGAGVSAESGIATYRDFRENRPDPDDPHAALWSRYDPMELATPEAFARDPELVTRWYDWRIAGGRGAEPNAAHTALATMERALAGRGDRFDLFTQNVDGLHVRAGSERLHELHGTICVWRCTACGRKRRHPGERTGEGWRAYPPRCACAERGLLRPDIVWFGEVLPDAVMAAADDALRACDLFFSIGTSAVVYPAAGFGSAARANGAATVEINLDPTPMSDLVDIAIAGRAGEVLPRVLASAGIGSA